MRPQDHLEYFSIELPQWPGVVLTVARTADGRLFFPIRTLCGILALAPQPQQERLRGDTDFSDLVDELPMPTVKGMRDTLCIEFSGLGGWLANIQSRRVRAEMQVNIRQFRRTVWASANEILLGRREPLLLAPTLRGHSHGERLDELTSLVLQVEDRLGAVEGAVFVPEHDDDPPASAAGEAGVSCPVCGAHFRVHIAPALA